MDQPMVEGYFQDEQLRKGPVYGAGPQLGHAVLAAWTRSRLLPFRSVYLYRQQDRRCAIVHPAQRYRYKPALFRNRAGPNAGAANCEPVHCRPVKKLPRNLHSWARALAENAERQEPGRVNPVSTPSGDPYAIPALFRRHGSCTRPPGAAPGPRSPRHPRCAPGPGGAASAPRDAALQFADNSALHYPPSPAEAPGAGPRLSPAPFPRRRPPPRASAAGPGRGGGGRCPPLFIAAVPTPHRAPNPCKASKCLRPPGSGFQSGFSAGERARGNSAGERRANPPFPPYFCGVPPPLAPIPGSLIPAPAGLLGAAPAGCRPPAGPSQHKAPRPTLPAPPPPPPAPGRRRPAAPAPGRTAAEGSGGTAWAAEQGRAASLSAADIAAWAAGKRRCRRTDPTRPDPAGSGGHGGGAGAAFILSIVCGRLDRRRRRSSPPPPPPPRPRHAPPHPPRPGQSLRPTPRRRPAAALAPAPGPAALRLRERQRGGGEGGRGAVIGAATGVREQAPGNTAATALLAHTRTHTETRTAPPAASHFTPPGREGGSERALLHFPSAAQAPHAGARLSLPGSQSRSPPGPPPRQGAAPRSLAHRHGRPRIAERLVRCPPR
ncbi:basic proline-rich protein-like [Pyrgilauda ruficollis]|uniref:basic proline-rich protein-like n=1 Tax=Pyrgilauda ruficollis TaxID=221976 RepID=UPI001B864686|nr:basic proline-rich protein-like [Pyrgilauda ruficollis]